MEFSKQIGKDDATSETSNEIKTNPKQQQPSILYQIRSFPITTSHWPASLTFILYFLFIIHTSDTFSENYRILNPQRQNFILITHYITQKLILVAYVLNPLLSIFCLLTVFFNQKKGQGIKFVFGWVGHKLFPVLRFMNQINLTVSAYFFSKDKLVGILFLIASGVNIFITFFAQNYTLRKDYLCCKSLKFLMFFKTILVIGYLANCLSIHTVEQHAIIMLTFVILHFLLALTLFILFFVFGYLIYRHFIVQIMMIIFINAYFGLSIGNLYGTLSALLSFINVNKVTNSNLIFTLCFFLFLNILSYCLWSSIKMKSINYHDTDVSKKIFFLYNRLENSAENIKDDCETRGIIRHHLQIQCGNIECMLSQNSSYYDAKKNRVCSPDKINQAKTSFIKFIIKCIYEQELSNSRESKTDTLIDFIEFYYTKLKNVFRSRILIAEVQKQFLTPFQKLKLVRIKNLMREQNNKLNHSLYGGNFDFENLVKAEIKFDEIQSQIKQVLKQNLIFWRKIQGSEINLSDIFNIFKKSLIVINQINENWKDLGKYLEYQKIWKFYYACFHLYLKNQKLSTNLLEYFAHDKRQDDVFFMEVQDIDKTHDISTLVMPKIMFEMNICCIHIDGNQQNPSIKTVNRYFEKIFCYQEREIIESPISILMTPSVQKSHGKKFIEWAGEGKSYNESKYELSKIYPVIKNKTILPMHKFIKQFQSEDEGLQYIALLKTNQQGEDTIIVNKNYQIQGITQDLLDKIGIEQHQYINLLGFNLLVLMPELKQHTKFKGFTQIKCKNKKNILSSRDINKSQELTKKNIIIYIPQNLCQVTKLYREKRDTNPGNKGQLKLIAFAIESAENIMQLNKNSLAFKLEINVKQNILQIDNSYSQIIVCEIEADNKSQKLLKTKKNQKAESKKQQSEYNEHQQSVQVSELLNKFYNKHEDSRNISLSSENNIFIKEQQNQPVKMISHINEISIGCKIIIFFILALIVGIWILEGIDYRIYMKYAQQYRDVLKFEINVLELNNVLYSKSMGLQVYQKGNIQLTERLQIIRNSEPFRNIILDSRLQQSFYTYGVDSRKFDQFDVIDSVLKNAIQIKNTGYKYIAPYTDPLQELQRLILPGLQTILRLCMTIIHDKFSEVSKGQKLKNYIYYGLGLIFGMVTVIILIRKFIKIQNNLVSILETFTYLNDSDIKVIFEYLNKITKLFESLQARYISMKQEDSNKTLALNNEKQPKQQSQSNQNSSDIYPSKYNNTFGNNFQMNLQKEIQNANLNKKVKIIEIGKEIKKFKVKSAFILLFLSTLCAFSYFGLIVHSGKVNDTILRYEESAYMIFEYYPIISLIQLSPKEKILYQKNFNTDRYALYLKKWEAMKYLNQSMINFMTQEYTTLFQTIFFGDFCEEYPEIIDGSGYSVQKCRSIAQNHLQHGIHSFMLYSSQLINLFLFSDDYQGTIQLGINFQYGSQLSNIALLYLIDKWVQQFNLYISQLETNLIILCLVGLIFNMSLYLYMQLLLLRNLRQKYTLFRKIYQYMMPDFVITKQKIIKARLQVEGIISR